MTTLTGPVPLTRRLTATADRPRNRRTPALVESRPADALVQLDARVSITWSSPTCLRVGGQVRFVELEVPSDRVLQVLARLRRPTPAGRVKGLIMAAGVHHRTADALARRLAHVLSRVDDEAEQTSPGLPDVGGHAVLGGFRSRHVAAPVSAPGHGSSDARLPAPGSTHAAVLQRATSISRVPVLVSAPAALRSTLEAAVDATSEPTEAAFALEVFEHVASTERTTRWMSADLPHVTVVTDGETAVISPVIVPGVTPCQRCTERLRVEDDAGWLTVASQLHRRTVADHDPRLTQQIAVEVTRVLRQHERAGCGGREHPTAGISSLTPLGARSARTHGQPSPRPAVRPLSAVLVNRFGDRRLQPWSWHASCGCRSL